MDLDKIADAAIRDPDTGMPDPEMWRGVEYCNSLAGRIVWMKSGGPQGACPIGVAEQAVARAVARLAQSTTPARRIPDESL